MVGPFNPRASILNHLALDFSASHQMTLAGDGTLPRDQKGTSRAAARLWGPCCPGSFFDAEEADLSAVLGPSEQPSPGGDLKGIKRWKRQVCEEEVPMGCLLRGKPETLT